MINSYVLQEGDYWSHCIYVRFIYNESSWLVIHFLLKLTDIIREKNLFDK